MTHQSTRRLTGEEIAALKFAAHRQLARWANKPKLSPRHDAQRGALKHAVHILHDHAFSTGCELHAPDDQEHRDA